jgi:hypothetical protein
VFGFLPELSGVIIGDLIGVISVVMTLIELYGATGEIYLRLDAQ